MFIDEQILSNIKDSEATILTEIIAPLKDFLDSLNSPIAIINTEGTYIYYNLASAKLDGTTVENALNKNILSLYPHISAKNSTMIKTAITGKRFIKCHTNYINHNGDEIDYTHTTLPIIKNNKILGSIEIALNYKKIISKKKTKQAVNLGKIIYKSKSMQELITNAKSLAKNQVPVMIYGETGTGKELIARLVHEHSERTNKPFIAVNCASIPESLTESLFFGSTKGAFTNAENKAGFIEMAEGGTLFLDELNSMSMQIQPKFLRFLQDKKFYRLGSSKEIKSNIRIIVAINQDPESLLTNNQLRLDLYYRLCVGYLEVPPLRERVEDIPLLVKYFIEKYNTHFNSITKDISKKAIGQLLKLNWSGNIRMLENTIIRSMIKNPNKEILFFEDILLPLKISLRPDISTPKKESKSHRALTKDITDEPIDLIAHLENTEKDIIEKYLISNRYNLAKTARILNLKRSTLQYKLKKHKLY